MPGRPRCRDEKSWRVLQGEGLHAAGESLHSVMTWQSAGLRLHASIRHCPIRHACPQEQVSPRLCILAVLISWNARPPVSADRLLLTVCCCRSLVAKSRLTLCDPVDCSPPGSSVPEICQARVLEWVAISTFQFKHHLLRDTCPDRRVKWSHSHLLCCFLGCSCLITLWHLLVS